ncbi:MAG: PepSY-like domain-containing protein [Muribaculaceae bacterium]|nr:PepSY-like domain-containing protein [Muribaculaceae bacterium]
MKKILKFLPMLLVGFMAVSLTACDDDDDPVTENELPATAKAFLNTYYPGVDVVSATKDKNEYDVILGNGHTVDFDKSGEWTDVDAPMGETVPSGFYPAAIDTYLAENNPGDGINEISKEKSGYDVDLVSGIDVVFNADGVFVRYEH